MKKKKNLLCFAILTTLFFSCSPSLIPFSQRKYRDFHKLEDYADTGIKSSSEEIFEATYRNKFTERNLDENYIHCRIDSIVDTIELGLTPEMHNPEFTYYSEPNDVCYLVLNVDIDDEYTSIYDPKIFLCCSEELFYQELTGVYDWGLMNYIKNLDSIVKNKLYHRNENILLMVKKSEIDKITSLSKSNAKIFCNICRYYGDNRTIVSDIFYLQSEYRLNEYYSTKGLRKYLYSEMKKAKKRIEKEAENKKP